LYKFVILIPSYNEYFSLRKIIKNLYSSNHILIMDDKSTDETCTLKKKFKKITLITNKNRLGYENNLKRGFKILLKKNFSHIITFDADGEHHISNIKKVKSFIIKNNEIDLLIGNRSYLNRFSERIVSFFFNRKYKIIDPLSGLKVYKSSALKKILNNAKEGFFLVDLLYSFLMKKKIVRNLEIISVKVDKRKTKAGSFLISNIKILKCLKFLV